MVWMASRTVLSDVTVTTLPPFLSSTFLIVDIEFSALVALSHSSVETG
jgi:hypothetical protein